MESRQDGTDGGRAHATETPHFQEHFQDEQLRLVAAQLGRLPMVLLAIDAFSAWLVLRAGYPVVALAWFIAASTFNAWRYGVCARERRTPSIPAGPALRRLSLAFVAASVLRIVPVPILFFAPQFELQVVYTMVCVGLAAGGVATAGGVAWAYATWAMVVGATLSLAWIVQGGFDNTGVGLLVAMLFGTLAHYAREQGRTLRSLLSLAYENTALAASLRRERDRAEYASQSKTRFFAAASHDLRQPLHALSINATTLELVAGRQTDQLVRELASSITRALRQSNDLLDVLLDISQLDAGAVEIEFEAVAPLAMLRRVQDQFLPAAGDRNLSIEVRAGEDLLALNTDARQLQRVLANLVSNSLKFTTRGGVVLAARPLDADHVQLSVIDTGPGIAFAEQERVFEDFYQLGNRSRDRNRGLGLGLSIVRRTAALLGIKVTLSSIEGQGCQVDLDVPALRVAAATIPAMDDEPYTMLDLRVLAIDDETDILESLAILLPCYGCEVRCAADLDAAWIAIDAGFAPQLLLVDHRLRDGSGADAIQALRVRLGPLPAVIVTGDTTPLDPAAAIHPRPLVVHKPVDGEQLTRAIRQAMAPI